MAISLRTGMPVKTDTNRRHHGNPGGWTIFWRCSFRYVDVNILLVECRRFNAEVYRPAANVGRRGRYRFLHDIPQIAGHRHLALAGHFDAFNRQQFTANLGPCKPVTTPT